MAAKNSFKALSPAILVGGTGDAATASPGTSSLEAQDKGNSEASHPADERQGQAEAGDIGECDWHPSIPTCPNWTWWLSNPSTLKVGAGGSGSRSASAIEFEHCLSFHKMLSQTNSNRGAVFQAETSRSKGLRRLWKEDGAAW